MKRIITFYAFLFIIFSTQTSRAQILTFEFSALAGNEASATSNFNNPDLASSTISRGAGLTASANGQRFNATDWALSSIPNAVAGNDYMEFTISPNSGFQFSVSSIVVQWQRSATGNTAIALRSSVDGYTTDLDAIKNVVDNTSTQTFTWTFAQANSTAAVTYRFYSYAEAVGGTGGPGDGAGNDITVYGSVTPTSTANDTDSEVDGPALASQPNPVLISSLADTDGEAVRVFDFDVYDYGTADALPTKITQVTIKPGPNNDAIWANTIAGAKLSIDGGSTFVTTGAPVITAGSIIFPVTSGNLDIANADAETVSLYVYLKNSGLVDNSTLEFIVATTAHGFTADASGSLFAETMGGAVSNEILVDVAASELRFVQQPTSTTVNLVMIPPVTVEATDENGNRDLDFNSSISLTSSGTLLGSPVIVPAVNGLCIFATLVHTAVGSNLELSAERNVTNDWDEISTAFNIVGSIPTINDVRINEVDSDTPGTDAAEFVELYGTPDFDLSGLVVVFYNGSNDLSYYAADLDGFTLDANGYFILGNSNLTYNPEITFAGNLLQNGADAVALYYANATDFPNNTPVTSTNLIDALVYDTNDSDDSGLLAGLNQTEQINESANNWPDTESIQRGSWFVATPTPRGANVMPVKLIDFNVQLKEKQTMISWKTATEANNDHFIVEWSRDAINFEGIAKVNGRGTTGEIQNYSYIHENPVTGTNYYRLTQTDLDGRKETFPVRTVFLGAKEKDINIVPTLAKENLKIEFSQPVENGRLLIYNMDGRMLNSYILAEGIDILRIDITELLPGQYIAKYIDGEEAISKKFIKQ